MAENPLAGGGGSYNGGSNQYNLSGVNPGDGRVIITTSSAQAPLAVNILPTSFINCNGDLTGALTASASSGTPPYSYTWMPGALSSSGRGGLYGKRK